MREPENWILRVSANGKNRWFEQENLPVSIGNSKDCEICLNGIEGSFQIGVLNGTFFVQPGKNTLGLRIDGQSITGSQSLEDGVVISFEGISASCTLVNGCLTLRTEACMGEAGEASTDLEELAREAGRVEAVEIAPISFSPKADDKSFGEA